VSKADIRICFVGDSMIAGTGDPEHLGWAGRVCAQAATQGIALTAYNLGVRRETSEDIAKRWASECAPRLPATSQTHLVFSFGVNDMTPASGRTRVSIEDSVDNLQVILAQAKTQHQILMVGPPPIADARQNERIADLSGQYSVICERLNVPYLPVVEALGTNTTWMQQVAKFDGAHPQAEGYMEFAKLVLNWPQWWFRSSTK
jgi:lysophospholipase L1-like esterase